MGRRLKELEPGRSRADRLGAELRRWRLLNGLSQDGLGAATCHSGALVSKIERGDRAASLQFCMSADVVLGTGGALERLWIAAVDDTPGAAAVADAAIARLRRALGTISIGDDRPPRRTLAQLADGVREANVSRLDARYADLADAVPELIVELANAELRAGSDRDRQRVAALMALTLRAADGLAFKLGHHDLSARLIDLMTARAYASEDPAMIAAVAYVAAETSFVTGDLATGYRGLVAALDRTVTGSTTVLRAAVGALHMRAAVVCARHGHVAPAFEHLVAARHAAERAPEGVYRGTAFGPDSFRIHELADGSLRSTSSSALRGHRAA